MSLAETTRERWYEAETYRIAGEISLRSHAQGPAKAAGFFERGLAIARAQQAKSWELRAVMTLATLWRDEGRQQQARDWLVPIFGWFTEGFETVDLKQAAGLLEAERAVMEGLSAGS
jgi:predicted ATPase